MQIDRLCDLIDERKEELFELLCNLIKINSENFLNSGNEEECARYIHKLCTELDLENNSWLVTYAPHDDPKIVVVVYIQNGYAGARSAHAAIETIEYYLDSLQYVETNKISSDNSLSD